VINVIGELNHIERDLNIHIAFDSASPVSVRIGFRGFGDNLVAIILHHLRK